VGGGTQPKKQHACAKEGGFRRVQESGAGVDQRERHRQRKKRNTMGEGRDLYINIEIKTT